MDAGTGGSIMKKTYDEVDELVENLASNHQQMMYDRAFRKSTPTVLQMDVVNTLSTHVSTLNKKI